METWDAIRARRNVRNYTAQAIDNADLDRILEAGWRSPSASNRQKWDFIVVTDRDQLEALSTVWRSAGHVARSAATIVLVLPEPEDERYRLIDQYDLGQATMAMMLAATDMGIGSGHSAVGDQAACRRICRCPIHTNAPTSSPSGIRLTARWRRFVSRIGARSTTWSTAAGGSRPADTVHRLRKRSMLRRSFFVGRPLPRSRRNSGAT